ncbi:MAG: hypothetical protein H0W88_05515 [Parachlamydiaceae bacterium]|nr:hypothetical protein [Parachlamydiaceae bacterium]
MTGLIQSIRNNFNQFYADPKKYYLPQTINLSKYISQYSFDLRHPEEYKLIKRSLNAPLNTGDSQPQTLDAFLYNCENDENIRKIIKERNFKIQPGVHNGVGIIFESPASEQWLIKQNFTKGPEDNHMIRWSKEVSALCIPFWFYPVSKWYSLFKRSIFSFQVLNDLINPMRVVMMRRGRQCVKKLKLEHVKFPKEYLFPLSSSPAVAPLHKKFVVISKKIDILDIKENYEKFGRMAIKTPNKLRKIIEEICEAALHTHLTDLHLGNIRFIKEKPGTLRGKEKNQVAIIDGEPIGGLKDISHTELKGSYLKHDYALFPLLGLRKLQFSSPGLMQKFGIPTEQVLATNKIFDEVIEKKAKELINERKWYYGKIIVSIICPFIPLVVLINSLAKSIFKFN